MNAPPAVEIVWQRGPGGDACIEGPELARRVGATLGRPVSARAAQAEDSAGPALDEVLYGEVQPRPEGRGWIAVVEVHRPDTATLRREVTLEAPSCRQLDEALVLVVALMADAAQPSAPLRILPSLTSASPTIAIGPDVAVAIGMLPGAAIGIGFASDVTLPPFVQIAAWAHVWPESEALSDGVGGRLQAWTFGAGLCLGPPGRGVWAAFGCGGASGGAILANGVGLDQSRSHTRPYLQAEITVGLRLHLSGPLFARAELGGAVPLARDSYRYTDADGIVHEAFHSAAVVPLARLGFEFRAP